MRGAVKRNKQILCSCVRTLCQVKHGKKLSVLEISNWEIYKTAGENAWSPGRRVHVKELQKAPFFVFKSQGPLEACHASATAAPSYFTPFSKATILSTQAFR